MRAILLSGDNFCHVQGDVDRVLIEHDGRTYRISVDPSGALRLWSPTILETGRYGGNAITFVATDIGPVIEGESA